MNRFMPGNRLTLLRSGSEYFPALLAAIEGASREIWLETYIYADDDIGRNVTGALIRAATGLLLRHEGEAFAAMQRIGNARAAVLQGAFAPDAGAAGWGDWTLEGYGV